MVVTMTNAPKIIYRCGNMDWMTISYPIVAIQAVPQYFVGQLNPYRVQYTCTIRGLMKTSEVEDLMRRGGVPTSGTIYQKTSNKESKLLSGEDTAWGPKTHAFTVERRYGTDLCQVLWQVEVVLTHRDCYGGALIYFISYSIDQHFYVTRQVSGVFVKGWDWNKASTPGQRPGDADVYRHYITDEICPVPAGWQRMSIEVRELEDKTGFNFTVVDAQRSLILPEGCTDGSATMNVRANYTEMGVPQPWWLTVEVQATFEAPPTKPAAPVSACYDFIQSCIMLVGGVARGHTVVRFLQIGREFYRNRANMQLALACLLEDKDDLEDRAGKLTREAMDVACEMLKRAYADLASKQKGIQYSLMGASSVAGTCGSNPQPTKAGILSPENTTLAIVNTLSGGRGGAVSAPYTWSQSFSYKLDSGRQVYYANGTPHVFRVREPLWYITVEGSSTAVKDKGSWPHPKPPFHVNSDWAAFEPSLGRASFNEMPAGTLLDAEVTPYINEDGTYGMTWRYLYAVKPTLSSAQISIVMPHQLDEEGKLKKDANLCTVKL